MKKIVHIVGGILIILLIIIIGLAYSIIQDQKKIADRMAQQLSVEYQKNIKDSNEEEEMGFRIFSLINILRDTRGLTELKYNPFLSQAGHNHLKDMQDNDYFAHNSEDKKFSDFSDVSYNKIAENLATGYYTVEEVVDEWMNSESHRKTMLGDFDELGVGVIELNSKVISVSAYFKK